MLNGDCARSEAGGKFLRRIAAHFANQTAVVTPNGKRLPGSFDAALAAWKKLPASERKRLDDLGKYDPGPSPPPGGAVLKVYARWLHRDPAGRLQLYKTKVSRSWEPGRDFLWLTAAECKALVPAAPRKGESLAVSDAFADRICRRVLIDLVRVGGNGGPRRPDEVLAKSLRLTVEGVSAERVRLRLDGSARLATHDHGSGARGKAPKVDDFRLLGFVEYDAGKKRLTHFDLVAFSETGHFDEIAGKTLPLGVSLELVTGDTPADRQPPSSFSKDYFAGPVQGRKHLLSDPQ